MGEDKGEEAAGLVFVALMFLGGGVGLLFGRPDVGGAIGMGAGFLAMAVMRARRVKLEAEERVLVGRRSGSALLALIGIAFVAGGISLLLGIPIPWRILGGIVATAVGLAFLAAAFRLVGLAG